MQNYSGADICTVTCEGTPAIAGKHALIEAAAHGETMQEQVPGRRCGCGEEPKHEQVF